MKPKFSKPKGIAGTHNDIWWMDSEKDLRVDMLPCVDASVGFCTFPIAEKIGS